MYVLVVYLIGATAWATTFDSSFQSFQSEAGCNAAKELIVSGTKQLTDVITIIECVKDTK